MTPLATDEVLRRFLDRIEADLVRDPLEIEPADHRRQFAALFGRCARGTHYELLELEPGAAQEEIHGAYQRVARLAHPVHSDRVGLEERPGVAQVLFERATEAYLVLSDPHRRSAYDRDAMVADERPAGGREEEARRVARELLERAQRLVEREDYHFAIDLLQQAILADPECAAAWALMGRCRARNPGWLHMASDSLRRAVDLEPDSTEFLLSLAEVEEARGRTDKAQRWFAQVLELSPDDVAAREGVERISGGEDG